MENKLTQELIEKAKLAKSVGELIALAKENGIELTEEEANTYFAQLNPKTGELGDDELDSVAGGGKCGTIYKNKRPVITVGNTCDLWRCEKCHEPKLDLGGIGYGYCAPCKNVGACTNCEYSHAEDGLLLCYHPQRYDN